MGEIRAPERLPAGAAIDEHVWLLTKTSLSGLPNSLELVSTAAKSMYSIITVTFNYKIRRQSLQCNILHGIFAARANKNRNNRSGMIAVNFPVF
jgi:hypothetical protein